ncbi:MAG: response regulator [Calditrichaeota bacterium]|nr:MAG: response regulator [Calditrichota bacterium]
MFVLLVVDDSPAICASIRKRLSGFSTLVRLIEVHSLEQAREVLERQSVNCVVLDLQLPDGSGYSLCEQLLSRRPHPDVLVFTAHTNPLIKNRCLASGAAGFYDKVGEAEAFFGQLESIIREQQWPEQ